MSFTDLIPHAPHVGLFAAPHIPESKLENALEDYAKSMPRDEVFALFDATLMGSAKDGAVFARDRMVFQNNDLQPIHEIRYEDIVQVDARRKLIGGRRVLITVNRGRATFEIEMDFSGKPQAADFVLRFLREAMLHVGAVGAGRGVETPSGRGEPDEAVGAAVAPDEPPRDADDRPRDADNGPRDADDRPRDADDGPRDADDRPRDADNGPRDADDGPHDADDGPRKVDHPPTNADPTRPKIQHDSGEAPATDVEAVSRALADLRDGGLLSRADHDAMLRVLQR